MLAYAALIAAVVMILFYGLFHKRFYNLNAALNRQKERQVEFLTTKKPRYIFSHFKKLRSTEVKISDTESYVYGGIFTVLLGFIVFNLWYATTTIEISTGTIFSIVSYSWEFVGSFLILPTTLQSWSRLSEIIERINHVDD